MPKWLFWKFTLSKLSECVSWYISQAWTGRRHLEGNQILISTANKIPHTSLSLQKRIISAWTLLISHYVSKWKQHSLSFLIIKSVSIVCCWGISIQCISEIPGKKTFPFSFYRCYSLVFDAFGKTLLSQWVTISVWEIFV